MRPVLILTGILLSSPGFTDQCLNSAIPEISSAAVEVLQTPTIELSALFCRGLLACHSIEQEVFNRQLLNSLPGTPPLIGLNCFGVTPSLSENGGSCGGPCNYHTLRSNYNSRLCGMSSEQFSVVNYYSSTGYKCFNTYLRGETQPNADVDALINTLNAALNRFPRYEGYVLRGVTLPPSVRQEHKQGAIVTYSSYTSTSASYPFPGNDQFIIYSRNGRPIMTVNPDESEVLFLPNTSFKVLEVTMVNGLNFYVMREVGGDPNSPSDAEILLQAASVRDPNREAIIPGAGGGSDSYVCPQTEEAIPALYRQIRLPSAPHDIAP